MVTIQGVQMTEAAAECVQETSADVAAEVAAIRVEIGRSGFEAAEGNLRAHCLDGADDGRVAGWLEYVAAVMAAAATPAGELGVSASNARPTAAGASGRHGAGVDVDVVVTLPDGQTVEGKVTLLPAEDGSPVYAAWGSADHWVSDGLLSTLYGAYATDRAARGDALTAIETAASRVAGRVAPWWLVRR